MSRASKTVHHTTIIKRSSKKGHGGHHGGAWKVAFADFTLAMMALFMVLWIVNSTPQKEREEVAAMLNSYSIFDGNVFAPIHSFGDGMGKILPGSGKILEQAARNAAAHASPFVFPSEMIANQIKVKEPPMKDALRDSKREMEELARIILKITESYDAQTNLHMEIVPQGLRILIQDDKSREMFQRGSATLTPFFNDLLTELVPSFNQIDNNIIITGHTDAAPYPSDASYNNWNLSGDRALVARRALEQAGLPSGRILQVNAMADQMLLDEKDPLSASNRRIEIMVLTKTASDSLYQFFGYHGEKVVASATEKVNRQKN
jgi:chemotaxis protein MotB